MNMDAGSTQLPADANSSEPEAAVDAGKNLPAAGWNLVAIDTPKRTYLDYVEVPSSGVWSPNADGFPLLAQWEGVSDHRALRFQRFAPGDVLSAEQIMALLPATARAELAISIADPPYNAAPAPADASNAIQSALDAAAAMASPGHPVDVLIPPGTFEHSQLLTVGAAVRLRRSPEDSGGILNATDPLHAAVRLIGDRSAALFLVLRPNGSARETVPASNGVWVGSDRAGGAVTHDAWVIGTEVERPAGAHFFALATEGDLWAFNYAHDGYADAFHHTGGSRFCQVIGNRAQTSAERGDDFYAFVGYGSDGDPVHHCSCIANWGRDGHARGLSAVGAGFIELASNDVDRTQWAGIYLAQENAYDTYGTFDVFVTRNTIAHANLAGSHDALLAYADAPTASHSSASFGDVGNAVRNLTVRDNTFRDTAAGIGNGFGIEIRASVDGGEVIGNTLIGNRAPQLVLDGSHFTQRDNAIQP
jgi:hypothetical protein